MIPSVQERKKNAHVFMNSYPNLCRLHNIIPNTNISVDGKKSILDFVGDRLKIEDWKPLLEAISHDKSLHVIRIRSRNPQRTVLQVAENESEARLKSTPKSSPLFTTYILSKLVEALSKCLKSSPSLTGLILEKIPLNTRLLSTLMQGLEVCISLQHLSFPYSQLHDDGCLSLCHVLRNRLTLVWLDLTGCKLTDKGVSALCKLLKFQKLNRYGESWKQSLRDRPVNPNIMPGLRRITLNHNSIGDSGVTILIEAILDDLWLKALDLQYCDITISGAEMLLQLVKDNKSLSVVDIRGNNQVQPSLVAAIVQQLAENNSGITSEFQWLALDSVMSGSSSTSGSLKTRSTQRFPSNATLFSKMPFKSISTIMPRTSQSLGSLSKGRLRSLPAKQVPVTNNISKPPWNYNMNRNHSSPSLKKERLVRIRPSSQHSVDVFSELETVKKQLIEVSKLIEEERGKRVQAEKELEIYKHIVDVKHLEKVPENTKPSSSSTVCQKSNTDLQNEGTSLPNQPETSRSVPTLIKSDSLESVIKAINTNQENPCSFDLYLSKCNPLPTPSGCNSSSSRAQLLFETLITT